MTEDYLSAFALTIHDELLFTPAPAPAAARESDFEWEKSTRRDWFPMLPKEHPSTLDPDIFAGAGTRECCAVINVSVNAEEAEYATGGKLTIRIVNKEEEEEEEEDVGDKRSVSSLTECMKSVPDMEAIAETCRMTAIGMKNIIRHGSERYVSYTPVVRLGIRKEHDVTLSDVFGVLTKLSKDRCVSCIGQAGTIDTTRVLESFSPALFYVITSHGDVYHLPRSFVRVVLLHFQSKDSTKRQKTAR